MKDLQDPELLNSGRIPDPLALFAAFALFALAAFALFALAARRVVWADSAGEPWYLPRAEPLEKLSPDHAARLLRKPWHAELIRELADAPAAPSRGVPGTLRRRERKRARAEAARRRARERWSESR